MPNLCLTKPSILFLFVSAFYACGTTEKKSSQDKEEEVVVRIREAVDASTLNPIAARDELSGYLSMKLFQSLLSIDYETLEIVPLLAESRPTMDTLPSDKLQLHYKIREEAEWDNGQPITADDVAFSLKVIKNPYSSNIGSASFYRSIEEIVYDSGSKKFSIIVTGKYILNEIASGDFAILPAMTYDTNAYLSEFSVDQLHNTSSTFDSSQIQKLVNFDKEFNSIAFQRNGDYINGSGSYELEEWKSGQEIVLSKKEDWWADEMDSVHTLFENDADKLIYTIISDNTTALVALKNHKIDVMRSIPSADFKKLKNDASFKEHYKLYSPNQIAYHYIGINHDHELLGNKNIRKALSKVVDVDKMIKLVSKGYAERIIGPIPSSSMQYNDTIRPFPFDVEKSKKILANEGWSDADQDGFLEKQINGEMQELEFDFIYNTDNNFRKYIAIILQEDARKAGIKLNLIPLEWNNYLDRLRNHQFDLFYGARILPPVPRDHKPIFHSESGGNYGRFSNSTADRLMDSIRVELNEKKRVHLNWRFQELIHEELPYIFLFAPKERIAISKEFDNLHISSLRPGYWEPGFKLRMN